MDTQRVRLFSSELVHLPHSAEKPNPLLESNQDMLMSSKRRQEKSTRKASQVYNHSLGVMVRRLHLALWIFKTDLPAPCTERRDSGGGKGPSPESREFRSGRCQCHVVIAGVTAVLQLHNSTAYSKETLLRPLTFRLLLPRLRGSLGIMITPRNSGVGGIVICDKVPCFFEGVSDISCGEI